MVEAVGGVEYAHYLLPPLENIAAVEEASVRDKVMYFISALFRSFFFLLKEPIGRCISLSHCRDFTRGSLGEIFCSSSQEIECWRLVY